MCFIIGQFISGGVLRGLVGRADQWGYRIPFALQHCSFQREFPASNASSSVVHLHLGHDIASKLFVGLPSQSIEAMPSQEDEKCRISVARVIRAMLVMFHG